LLYNSNFQQWLLKPGVNIRIYCFFEEKPVVGVGIIVSEQSAVLSGYPNRSIAANHIDMTRFSGKNDIGYQRVLSRVHDYVELMNSISATDTSQEELERMNEYRQLLEPHNMSGIRRGIHTPSRARVNGF
jgi:hypothetical protein